MTNIDTYAPMTGNMLASDSRVVNIADTIDGIAASMGAVVPHTTMRAAAVVVGTTAVLLAAGTGTLSGRRVLEIFNNSSAVIFYGPSGVTTASGVPLLPNERALLPVAADVYAVAGTAGNNVRVAEYK